MNSQNLSFTALKGALGIAVFALTGNAALVGSAALAGQTARNLSCEQQDESAEPAAMKQTPHGARRVDTHVLEVASRKATRQFVDQPPHDEGDLSGRH